MNYCECTLYTYIDMYMDVLGMYYYKNKVPKLNSINLSEIMKWDPILNWHMSHMICPEYG